MPVSETLLTPSPTCRICGQDKGWYDIQYASGLVLRCSKTGTDVAHEWVEVTNASL